MSFFVPQGPTIPGSANLSDVRTSLTSLKSVIASKVTTTIPSVNVDTICNFDGSQGTIEITFTDSIAPSTRSPGLLIFQSVSNGPKLNNDSLIFINMINTSNTSGTPYLNIVRVIPQVPPGGNGQMHLYVTNIDSTTSIEVGDTATFAFLIIS